jgi:hypothetical protein
MNFLKNFNIIFRINKFIYDYYYDPSMISYGNPMDFNPIFY